MNKIKMLFMIKKPTMSDFVDARMSRNAKTVVLASLEDVQKEQNQVLKKAKMM